MSLTKVPENMLETSGFTTIPRTDNANVFTATQQIKSTDAGATAGPTLELYRDSASPAAADDIGQLSFQGEDSAGNLENYVKLKAIITDATSTSEDGKLAIQTVVAGTLATRVNVGAGIFAEGVTGGDPGAGKANFTGLQIAGAPLFATAYLEYRDEKSAGTHAGTFTSGAWQTRTLNVESSDAGGHGSLASNQITLVAGTYEAMIIAPAHATDTHQARLQNITDASTTLVGIGQRNPSANGVANCSFVTGRFTIAATKVFEVQHRCTTTRATDGFGFAANVGATEVYALARFWKVG